MIPNTTVLQPLRPGIRQKAATILRAQGLMGLDAMVLGESELALGITELKTVTTQAGVTVLCANLEDERGQAPFAPRKIVETGGLRVGLLGILDIDAQNPPGSTLLQRSGLRLTDPLAAAQREITSLRQEKAQLIVLLHHGGVPRARTLAAKLEGVNLILAGHSGYRLSEPEKVGQAYLLEAGRRGQELGHVELRLGDGFQSPTLLVDDSRRHVLYQEINKELKRNQARRRTPPPRRANAPAFDPLARAKMLVKQYQAIVPQPAKHSLISTFIELDDTFADQPTVKGLINSSKASWNDPAAQRNQQAQRQRLQARQPVRPQPRRSP